MKRFLTILMLAAVSVAVGVFVQKLDEKTTQKKYPLEYTEYVEKYAEEYEIPTVLLYSVIKCESNFNPEAKSHAGAVGLMQLMPATFEDMMNRCGESFDEKYMTEPEMSIRYGAYYMNYLFKIFKNWDLTLAAYNGGMGNVRKWMQDSEIYDGGKIIKYPKGFSETENYVKKVNETVEMYNKLYFEKGENYHG